MCVPVLAIGMVLYAFGTLSASYLEGWGRREFTAFMHRKSQTALDSMLRVNLKSGVFLDNFLGYVLYAESISSDGSQLENVLLAPGRGQDKQNFMLFAPSASIVGSVAKGDLKMSFDYGMIHSSKPNSEEASIVKFKSMEIDLLRIFQDQIFGADTFVDDYRGYSPGQLSDYLKTVKNSTKPEDRDTYLKANFLFHQRFGMPFATIVFAIFGLIFGIQDERRGKSYGYLLTISTIMIGYVVFMVFKWIAEKGSLDAFAASWIPNIILGGFGWLLLWQKSRLPLSESPLDMRYWKRNWRTK
jgi:lipopolysaccharide export LptBFGC system permease protein LptF